MTNSHETSVWSTAQKVKFSSKDFFSKCDQIRRKLQIWSYLIRHPLMENFIFGAVENSIRVITSLEIAKANILTRGTITLE